MIDPDHFPILVVDDDQDVLEDMCDALAAAGHCVRACSSGLAAVEAALETPFDLIVADIRMPGMDGLAALEKMRGRLPHMRSIVVTGYTAESDSIRAVRLGVGDYLRKPFRSEALLSAVARQQELCLAEKRRSQREQNLRRAALWALEALSREISDGDAQTAASRLAFRTAQELGLPVEVAEEIQQAALARCLPERIGRQGLPPPVQSLVAEVQTGEQSPSLGARVLLAVSGERQEQDLVGAALARARQPASVPYEGLLDANQSQRRSLYYLARTLETSQPEAARKAYQTLAAATGTAEEVDAWLGLMRLERGDPTRALQELEKAVEAARRLTPWKLAGTSLEAGCFLLHQGQPRQAYAYFQEALQLSQEFSLPFVQASATLGLLAAPDRLEPDEAGLRAFAELLKPAHRADLLPLVGWLLPWTVRRQASHGHPAQTDMLVYLARECPDEFQPLLQAGVPVEQRLVAIQALRLSGHAKVQEWLRQLTADDSPAIRRTAEAALAEGSAAQPPTLRIYTLGRFEVYRGEEALIDRALRGQRGRFLLAWLATSTVPLSVDRIADEFWPEENEAGRNNLNTLVSYLRKLLRPPSWPDALDYVVRNQSQLQLNRTLPVWVDAVQFLEAAAQGGLEGWRQAVELYRGPYLEACYMEWAVGLRDRLESTARACFHKLLPALLDAGRYQEVLEQGNRMLELDPCCQQTHAQVMQAQIHLKRPEAAMRQFEVCQRTLKRELGMEPSIALLELYQRARLSLA